MNKASLLDNILSFIADNNKYYNNIVSKNKCCLNNFPLLTRDELQINGKNICDLNKLQRKTLYTTSSSGSTGKPVTVYWNHNNYLTSMRTLWQRRNNYYGITPLSRKLEFTCVNDIIKSSHPQYKIDNNTVLSFQCSSLNSQTSIIEACNIIEKFQPEWIYIQPSILKKIIYVIKNKNLNIPKSIKYIECIGEILYDDLREEILEVFNYPSVASMYGSEEMNGIAIECPYHNMHIISDNVYVECYSDGHCHETGYGEIVITNLRNYAQPLIRYLQGDIVEIAPPIKCLCGYYNDKIIKKISGRVRENIFIELDNLELDNFILNDCIRITNKKLNNIIIKYKFIFYKSLCELLSLIYVKDKLLCDEKNIVESIKDFFQNKGYNNLKVNVEILNMIYDEKNELKSNKYMTFEIRD